MKLTFYGACHEVTGSMYLLQANEKNILIDCGMEQGKDEFENQTLKIAPTKIDCVVLTHAHIDHSGNLPLLVKEGFEGKIYTTNVTKDLCEIMLRDCAHIQEFEAQWKNRKRSRKNEPEIPPLYSMENAEETIKKFIGLSYGEKMQICPGVEIEYFDAGHLLGSGSVNMHIEENGIKRSILFSGDIGNISQPILKDPTLPKAADYVVMESTYGDRTHEKAVDYVEVLSKILNSTFEKGGNVVIPSFAVGRTQEMLYFLRIIKEKKLVKINENFPVYVDSPLAVEATNIFNESSIDYFDEEARALIGKGINPIAFDGLFTSTTTDESKAINLNATPKVIISASGMCEAGRIRHHLKHNLYKANSTILFVGYQASGTLGRALIEGAKTVKLFGETIAVNAKIEVMPAVSSHGDSDMLEKWVASINDKPKRVFITHGEDDVVDIFKDRITQNLSLVATAPYSGECWDLGKNEKLSKGNEVPLEDRDEKTAAKKDTIQYAPSDSYTKLVAKGKELEELLKANKGKANRDLEKLSSDIDELIKRWKD